MSTTAPFIPSWNQKPFPGVSLSAGGLLALADLQTIAKRTAITGGASWADAFLLAPGLHYQQAAGDLFRKGNGGAIAITKIVDQSSNGEVTLELNNAATAEYIQSIAKPGQEVILDIGRASSTGKRYMLRRSASGKSAVAWLDEGSGGLGWFSHLLYLSTLFLTIATITLVVLFKDWWCLVSILGYMTSRLLNIYIIKRRTASPREDDDPLPTPKLTQYHSQSSSTSNSHHSSGSRHRSRSRISLYAHRAASYLISFGDDKTAVRLRGKMSDLRAVTSDAWLRSKTNVEGYLEAAAKLIVWVVAALSGNMTQVGSLMMMVLLILSAGLLAVSNSRAGGVRVNGRVAKLGKEGDVETGEKTGKGAAGLGSTSTSLESLGDGGGDERRGRGDEYRPATAAVDSRVGEEVRAGRAGTFGRPVVDEQVNGSAKGAPPPPPPPVVNRGRNPVDSAERGEAGHMHVKWKEGLERPGQRA
ncbi:hypothetical protein B0T21DRAFT_287116 [Apiosordaria backusii]|uniref:Uncharacterized protein n=1 Tax=Apiosordaria backusii TaxID=314023 RepID=A0AA40BNG9_9PEZI|nr:hypothetical protein B0T21DRAFT_287116 [Apiosordaria backusii]